MSVLIAKALLQGQWDHYTENWHQYSDQFSLNIKEYAQSWKSFQQSQYQYNWKRFALSERLASVAELCSEQSIVMDIGTDHARLPIALLRSHKITWAAGVDINEKPLLHTKKRLKNYQTYPHLLLIQADGFEALEDLAQASHTYCQWRPCVS